MNIKHQKTLERRSSKDQSTFCLRIDIFAICRGVCATSLIFASRIIMPARAAAISPADGRVFIWSQRNNSPSVPGAGYTSFPHLLPIRKMCTELSPARPYGSFLMYGDGYENSHALRPYDPLGRRRLQIGYCLPASSLSSTEPNLLPPPRITSLPFPLLHLVHPNLENKENISDGKEEIRKLREIFGSEKVRGMDGGCRGWGKERERSRRRGKIRCGGGREAGVRAVFKQKISRLISFPC